MAKGSLKTKRFSGCLCKTPHAAKQHHSRAGVSPVGMSATVCFFKHD
ncbi:hypothetical protein HMPREF9123_0690 [Neisseria bacilliformis ATCC BAA-1200]|uniref:Uncharacterized protein n=1 Tax=Neisseria bacilliformis ATCC BAA-1200 TaxID=888742 RepID=F2BAI7_9NEIS|nr:hypothetical protein HMPREF9123_0690 [Neisseria bacilliformis ATCC BAA-1200]